MVKIKQKQNERKRLVVNQNLDLWRLLQFDDNYQRERNKGNVSLEVPCTYPISQNIEC